MFKEPIAFIDIETTGLDVLTERIIQIAVHKVYPDGRFESKCVFINPEKLMTQEIIDIHHITNEELLDKPFFRNIAKSLFATLDGCVIAGYNSDYFDLGILAEEFNRCGIEFPSKGTRTIDIFKIEKIVNSHKLVDVYKRYTGKELLNAHNALMDSIATHAVLKEQITKYGLSSDIDDLIELTKSDEQYLDLAKKLTIIDNKVCWSKSFGKNKGRPILDDRSYIKWFLEKGGCQIHTRKIIEQVLSVDACDEQAFQCLIKDLSN